MKSTSLLSVLTDLFLEDDIVIHPNEGYDLGIISPTTPVKIFSNLTIEQFKDCSAGFFKGNLLLKNQCRIGTIHLGKKLWKRIGMPDKIKLINDNDKILISS